jgi:hypothetical protein
MSRWSGDAEGVTATTGNEPKKENASRRDANRFGVLNRWWRQCLRHLPDHRLFSLHPSGMWSGRTYLKAAQMSPHTFGVP